MGTLASNHRTENTTCQAWFQTALGFMIPLDPKKKHVCTGKTHKKHVTNLALPENAKQSIIGSLGHYLK